MKYVKTLMLFLLVFGSSYGIQAQACGFIEMSFSVRDNNGELLKDVYFEFFENNDKDETSEVVWDEKEKLFKSYRRGFRKNILMKVASKGFETHEQKINYKTQRIDISLKRESSITVSGAVYDPIGAVFVGADISVRGENDKTFYAKTNDEEIYKLELAPANYEIEFAAPGFKRLRILNFNVISSTNGKFNHDVILTVRDCDHRIGGLIGEISKESNIIVLDFKNQTIKK